MPDARLSCCHLVSTRLPSAEFQPSREQRQVLNRWNRYILGSDCQQKAKLLHPLTREKKRYQRNNFDFDQTVSAAELSSLPEDLTPEHAFEVELCNHNFTDEKYQLYAHYQRNIHNEPIGKISAETFGMNLCSSPFFTPAHYKKGRMCDIEQFGTFHLCFRVDGQLMALSVIDILPQGISSVYFIYDTAFEKFSPGKISVMYEIALARKRKLRYFYLGLILWKCPKLRYKASYSPQYVLDLGKLDWVKLDKRVETLLKKDQFVSFIYPPSRILYERLQNQIHREEDARSTSKMLNKERDINRDEDPTLEKSVNMNMKTESCDESLESTQTIRASEGTCIEQDSQSPTMEKVGHTAIECENDELTYDDQLRELAKRAAYTRNVSGGLTREEELIAKESIDSREYVHNMIPLVFHSAFDLMKALKFGRVTLLSVWFPGTLSADEVMKQINFDKISIVVRHRDRSCSILRATELPTWNELSFWDSKSFKAVVAEIASCVGPIVGNRMSVLLDV